MKRAGQVGQSQVRGNGAGRVAALSTGVALAAVLFSAGGSWAQNATWNGPSGDWDTAASWTPVTVPTDTATFAGASPAAVTFSAPITSIGGIQFNAGAGAVTFDLSGNQLNITGAGIANNSTVAQTFNNNSFTGVIEFQNSASAGNATIHSSLGGGTFFTGNSMAGNATITGDNGSATGFSGSSTAGNATITNITIGATTSFSGNSTAGNARLINQGGIFDFSEGTGPSSNHALSAGSIEGDGFLFLGANQLTVGGNNQSTTFSGVISDCGGGGGGVCGAQTFNLGLATTGGSLVKTGTGTLTLSGANTYTGATNVNAGTLQAGAVNAFASSSAFTVAGGATLDLNGTNQIIGSLAGAGTVSNNGGSNAVLSAGVDNSSTTFSGLIEDGTKDTGLTKAGTGTLILSGANTYTGPTNVSGGTLQLGNASAAGAGVLTIGDGAAVRVTATGALSNSAVAFAIGATGTLAAAAGTNVSITRVTMGANSVAQFGSATDTGTIVLNGSSGGSSSDVVIVAGGTLTTTTSALATLTGFVAGTEVQTGATLDFNSQSAQIAALTGGGTVKLGSSTLDINGGNFTGGIQGTGGVTVDDTPAGTNGTLILGGTGLNTYTGATTVTAGHTLQGGAANAFAAASATTVIGTLDLGGFDQAIGSLAGGGMVANSAAGAAVLTANGDNTSTSFSGTIQDGAGTVGLTKTGTGTLTLSGANTYTGATTVTGGTLLQGSTGGFASASAFTVASGAILDIGGFNTTIGSLAGAGDLHLGSGILTAGGDNSSTTFSGVITGDGGFIKAGTGRTNLTGISTYSGDTTVNAGTLSVNGSIVNSDFTVNAGGTLGGNGTVGNTVINGGTLAPGNSIGLLTVQGNLTFTSASSYMVEVSPSNADRTNVTGAATLGGATVNAVFAPGTFVAKQYTILSAAGGVSGSFNGPVNSNLPSGFHTSLSTDANNAFLNLVLNFAPPPNSGGLSINQQNVANAITGSFNANGGIALAFGMLTPNGLTQASGEIATGTQQTTFDAMNLFMGAMMDPFMAGRGDGGSATGGATGYADAQALGYARPRKPNDALAAIYAKAPQSVPFEARWSTWVAGYGGSQTTDGNAALGSNNTTSSVYGTAVGADYRFSPFTIAGFALVGGGTSFSVNGSGSGHSDLFQAGAFVRHTVGPAYVSAALAYGWQDITTNRTVTIAGADQLRAEFNANAFSGRLEGGYRFVTPFVGGLGVTPYAAGQFTTFDLPSYAESALSGASTFALGYGAQSVTDARSELGIRTDKSFAVQDGIFTLRGRFAWAHDYDPDRSIAATFQALPGASFVVNGAAQASDSALTTVSAEMKWTNGWSVAATFEGEFSDVTASYAGKGIVRYAW